MSETRYFSGAQKRVYWLGQNIGFALAFLIFSSVLYFILSRLDKLPGYIMYWHFAGAAIILSILISIIKSLKNE